MGRKSASNTRHNCLICQVEFAGVDKLKNHLAEYINFRVCLPFPCGGCDYAFKTKDERNEHCKKEGHTNEYKTNDDQSKEMLLGHLLFDAEQAKLVGVESLVKVKHEIFYSALNTLQCKDDKMLACTLCAKKMDSQVLRNHIKQHLKYKKYTCNCMAGFYSEDDLAQHTLSTGHQQGRGMKNNEYCEMIMDHLMMESKSNDTIDVINACKAAAMIETQCRLSVLQLPTKRTRITRKERTFSNTAPASDLEPCSLLCEERINDTEPRPSTSRIDVRESRAETVQNEVSASSSKQQQSSVTKNAALPSVPWSVSSMSIQDCSNLVVVDDRVEPMRPTNRISNNVLQYSPLDLRTTQAEIMCTLCKKSVSSEFLQRQKHVADKHMRSDHSDEDYTDLFEDAMKRAFPGRTFSSNQCNLCGLSKCSDSSARREHVKKKHSDMLIAICCPLCNQTYGDITLFKKHWKNDHKDGKNADSATKKLVDRRKKNYGLKLTEITNVAYPEETSEGVGPVTLPDVEPITMSFSETRARRTHVVAKHSAGSQRKSYSSDSDSGTEIEVIDNRMRSRNNTMCSVAAQVDSQEEREHIHATTPSFDSSTDDGESILEIAPPATHLAPFPALYTQSTIQQRVSPHSCNIPQVRRCTKRVPEEPHQPEVQVISSHLANKEDEIEIVYVSSGTTASTTSSPVAASLGSGTVTPSTSKKSRLASEENTNCKDSQNKSRWDQKERNTANGQKKSDAKVRRFFY